MDKENAINGVLLYQNCEKAVKITIPAIRVAVSRSLSGKYKMSETEIAKRLGIAQAAVSKYLSGKYSTKIATVVRAIEANRLHRKIVEAVIAHKSLEEISDLTDSIASERKLVDIALKHS
jgi:predicted transcriptional regulator